MAAAHMFSFLFIVWNDLKLCFLSFTSTSTTSSSTSSFPTAPWLTSPTGWETSSTSTSMSAVTRGSSASRSSRCPTLSQPFDSWPENRWKSLFYMTEPCLFIFSPAEAFRRITPDMFTDMECWCCNNINLPQEGTTQHVTFVLDIPSVTGFVNKCCGKKEFLLWLYMHHSWNTDIINWKAKTKILSTHQLIMIKKK